MTIEIIVLALVSTVRPTSLAAACALLSAASPRRLMIAYAAAGLAFTIAFGLLVVLAFNGIDINSGTDRTKAIAELGGGVLALAFAVCLLTGWIGGACPDDAPRVRGRWDKLLERRPPLPTAAVAGPATHVPGLFYLIALNLIVAHEPRLPAKLFEVLTYNAIWFAIPCGALAACLIEAAATSIPPRRRTSSRSSAEPWGASTQRDPSRPPGCGGRTFIGAPRLHLDDDRSRALLT